MKTLHVGIRLKERDTTALLLGILFASAALRMYSVTTPAIIDEPFSLYVAKLDPSLIISSCASDVHPPLYYLILHYWILVFQDSELAMRLPSVVFSVLAVYVVYRIGGRLFSREVGLLSALIAGISAFQIAEAQSARMYSLLVLLTLVSMYAFIRLRDETTWGRSLEYVAVTVALLYTHVYGIFIVVAQNLFVLSIALIMKRCAPHPVRGSPFSLLWRSFLRRGLPCSLPNEQIRRRTHGSERRRYLDFCPTSPATPGAAYP